MAQNFAVMRLQRKTRYELKHRSRLAGVDALRSINKDCLLLVSRRRSLLLRRATAHNSGKEVRFLSGPLDSVRTEVTLRVAPL